MLRRPVQGQHHRAADTGLPGTNLGHELPDSFLSLLASWIAGYQRVLSAGVWA